MRLRISFRYILLLLASLTGGLSSAQEFRAEVEVRPQDGVSLPATSRDALRQQLLNLFNQTQWTALRYLPQERIELQIGLILRGQTSEGWWQGELTIQARRPVYHSTYKTTTLLLRDAELSFPYEPGLRLRYQHDELDHPLTALLAYYAYYALASDLDSFSPLGGDALKSELSQIASLAEGHSDWTGWQARGKGSERRRLLERFEQAEERPLRQAWYHYHRLGLDQLADQPEEARQALLTALKDALANQPSGFPTTTLRQLEETKLSELIELFRSSTPSQRAELRELLQELSPRSRERLQALR